VQFSSRILPVHETTCPRNVLSANGRVREVSCPRIDCPGVGLSAKSLVKPKLLYTYFTETSPRRPRLPQNFTETSWRRLREVLDLLQTCPNFPRAVTSATSPRQVGDVSGKFRTSPKLPRDKSVQHAAGCLKSACRVCRVRWQNPLHELVADFSQTSPRHANELDLSSSLDSPKLVRSLSVCLFVRNFPETSPRRVTDFCLGEVSVKFV